MLSKQFLPHLARCLNRKLITPSHLYIQHGIWILKILPIKCSTRLVCKKHMLFSFHFFNTVLPCLHFLKLHIYQFMNYSWDWKKAGEGAVLEGWGRRGTHTNTYIYIYMLEVLGKCFLKWILAILLKDRLQFVCLFLWVVFISGIVPFGMQELFCYVFCVLVSFGGWGEIWRV